MLLPVRDSEPNPVRGLQDPRRDLPTSNQEPERAEEDGEGEGAGERERL